MAALGMEMSTLVIESDTGALFLLVGGLLLLRSSGASTFDKMEEDEQCAVVVIVVVSAAFVVIVGFGRVCGLSDGCQFGCRWRDDRVRGSCGLRAVFHRSEPRSVLRDILVLCLHAGWLQVQSEVTFPSLGRYSLRPVPFCSVDIAGFQGRRGVWESIILVFFPACPTLSDDPLRDFICC